MKKRFLAVALLATIAAAAGIGTFQWIATNSEDIAQQRIDFTLTDTTGTARQASEWDGKVVLINFWAPWCAPCRAEIPLLIELQKQYADQGLQILGPALDNLEPVTRFADDYGITYPLFVDLNNILNLQEAYGDTRLPFSVLLDREGQVVYRHAGELEKNEIEAQISAIISQ